MARWFAIFALLVAAFAGHASAQDAPDRVVGDTKPFIIGIDVRSMIEGLTDEVVSLGEEIGDRVTKPNVGLSSSPEFQDNISGVTKITFSNRNGVASLCTGVLLDLFYRSQAEFPIEAAILTAGHCACGAPGSYSISFRIPGGKDVVSRGLVDVPRPFDPLACRASLFADGVSPGRDLAILRAQFDKFSTSFNEEDLARSVPGLVVPISNLMAIYRESEIERLIVAGFGLTDDGGVTQGATPLVGLVDISSHFCSDSGFGCRKFREFILAERSLSGTGSTDTCGGDSGGPVFSARRVAVTQGVIQELVLVGITSRALPVSGNSNSLRCGGGGIYTAVGKADVIDWMRSLGISPRLRLFYPAR